MELHKAEQDYLTIFFVKIYFILFICYGIKLIILFRNKA